MGPTPLIDDLFIALLASRDAINTPFDKEEALEIISGDSRVVTAWTVENPEFARTLSSRLINGKVQSAVSRRFEVANKQKGRLPLYYYHDTSKHLFRLFSDWQLRQKHGITIDEYPLPENKNEIVSLFSKYVDHPRFSRNTSAKFRDGVIGISKGLGYAGICRFCGVVQSKSIPLYAAHIVAKKWFKALGFKERQSFDVLNGFMLCDGCHKSLDSRKISLSGGSGGDVRWQRDDSDVGQFHIPEEDYMRILEFVYLRNRYLSSCNSLKTTTL